MDPGPAPPLPWPAMTTPPPATSVAGDWLTVNRVNWDGRVPVHVDSAFYDLPGFVEGRNSLRDFEVEEVGDVRGRSLLHLQCHIGLDTLSWARLGAEVTGLDFSVPALEVARDLAGRTGTAASSRFVTSDVYEAVTALDGRGPFDIVYTGLGALCWLPDLPRWARTVARLLAPGGFLHLTEFHPFSDVLGEDGRTVEEDYFARGPLVFDYPHTYTDGEELPAPRSVQWQHGLGDVVTALAGAGLRLEFLHERDGGHFRFPEGTGAPQVYSLQARKPE